MSGAVLYTLGPSHYCERARWGLDRRGIDYAEHRLALGPHAVRLRAKGLASTALPVLQLADGRLVQGSDRILDHCGWPVLDPAFEARFATTVGALVRRFIYAAAFSSPDDGGIAAVLLDGVDAPERLAGLAAWPLLRPRLAKALGATPDALSAIAADLDAELAWFDVLLGEDALGEGCDRSAITAASLLSSLVRPREHPVSRRLDLAPAPAAILRDWADRPSLAWVRATYRRERAVVERRNEAS